MVDVVCIEMFVKNSNINKHSLVNRILCFL
jgi:hypothetical protein